MLIKLYNYLKEKDEELGVGLAVGLAVGFAVGLAEGLAVGLAVGFAVGLAWGLAWGLAGGFAVGLAGGLAWGLAVGLGSALVNLNQLMPINVYSIVSLVLAVVILLEVLMYYEPKLKKATYGQVLWRKLVALLESSIYIINSMNIIWIIKNVRINIKQYLPTIIQWIGYIGITIICLAIVRLIGYYWLKSSKRMLTKKGSENSRVVKKRGYKR